MAPSSGERFGSQNLADCAFCPAGGRRFRTARSCARCDRPLCLACRPLGGPDGVLCPDCGGGRLEHALEDPRGAHLRLTQAGGEPPLWLTVMVARLEKGDPASPEELIPE